MTVNSRLDNETSTFLVAYLACTTKTFFLTLLKLTELENSFVHNIVFLSVNQ